MPGNMLDSLVDSGNDLQPQNKREPFGVEILRPGRLDVRGKRLPDNDISFCVSTEADPVRSQAFDQAG